MMKKNFLITNVNIATMSCDSGVPLGVIEDAAMIVSEGIILWLGKNQDRKKSLAGEECIDGQGGWLLPGFIDCHTHLVYAGNRANEFQKRMEGQSYEAIAKAGGGIQNTVNATRKETPEDLYQSAANRLSRLLSEGVTTVEIKSGYGLDESSELKMLEVIQKLDNDLAQRLVATCLAAHAVPLEYKHNPEGYVAWVVEEFLPKVQSKGLASQCDVFCESIGFSLEQSQRVLKKAQSLGMQIKGHVEQLSCLGGSKLLAEMNGLSVDHLEYLDNVGIEVLAKQQTTPVLLPAAFYFLRETQKPPIPELRKAGVEFAIATDLNPGSSPCGSLLLAANMAAVLLGCTVEECLLGITRIAAKALGVDHERGQLKKGMTADFSLWNIQSPSELIYGMSLYSPVAVFIGGEKVYG
ncbi:MAG: imidazolonepropionase [Cellvibrionales bacterium]|nr:imidazolonepropionase [Cellvibrionales bacterium]